MNDAPRGWIEGLDAALVAAGWPEAPPPGPAAAAEAFAARVPNGYVDRTTPMVAAADLIELAALIGDGRDAGGIGMRRGRAPVRMAVQPDPDPGAGLFRFRLYGLGAMELSRFVPILESFGLTVVEAIPYLMAAPDGRKALHLDDFGLRARGRWPFTPLDDGARLVAGVEAAWRGESEVDPLNRLVVRAGLDWHDVVVLRAYRRFRRQAGSPWTDRQLDDPLVEFPAVAIALLRYFAARFDPGLSAPANGTAGDGGGGVASAREAVLAQLGSVERLEQDQVLRSYLGLMDATIRTSHYVRTPGGQRLPTLALKLSCASVPELPPPRPSVEAFVYSPRVEGMHLRGGRIARGGIRWSDRQDDLRTEVLGLVRAQVLKNASIVPTGAKGGYCCKWLARPDRDSDSDTDAGSDIAPAVVDVGTEVRECYRLFVGGLLDITDNVVGGAVVTPPSIRRADGEDSYLVVAADRGTATFSDLANEISQNHHFWLGDAFASGGRHGYDHKAMGITARGAWVAARQHFRQLGIDPEREEIRVIGVGDMSGDVFGNGMLRSRTIKLVAAFDHRHIFVDPNPDPAASFSERARLFELPRSSWLDYDRSALSAGGGVWSRNSKEIALSAEARRTLGLSAAVVSPPELVTAILTSPADLLWLGGIGTFVKAPSESHADVGDRANDTVRVNADQVRARVVAEGGNLGFTQRARIAYSRRGGKINTDFIDNAAGVATSDYEVNLKILLALAIERDAIPEGERDSLLASVQEEVGDAVLNDVGLTALAVTRAVPASANHLDAYDALMSDLEDAGHLDRQVEWLPAGEEMALRRAAGAGLTRPEAAVVLALAKSDLAHALETSTLVADPLIHDAVVAYFPAAIAQRFADLLGAHRLYPELASTRVAHEIVDRMGVTWAHETADEFGVGLADVAAAYWVARGVLGAETLRREVGDLAATIGADAEDALDLAVAQAVHAMARRYLVDSGRFFDEDLAIARRLASAPLNREAAAHAASLVELGVASATAPRFALLPTVALAPDIGVAARALDVTVDEVPALLLAFEAFDSAMGLAQLRDALGRLSTTSRWGRWQVGHLLDDVATLRCEAVVAALGAAEVTTDPMAALDEWMQPRSGLLDRFGRLAAHLRTPADNLPAGDGQSIAALAVRAVADLVHARPDPSK